MLLIYLIEKFLVGRDTKMPAPPGTNINGNNSPYVEIIEQPSAKSTRYVLYVDNQLPDASYKFIYQFCTLVCMHVSALDLTSGLCVMLSC